MDEARTLRAIAARLPDGAERVAEDLRKHVADCQNRLDNAHEDYRHGGKVRDFLRVAAGYIAARNRAEARLHVVASEGPPPDRPAPAAELYALATGPKFRRDEAVSWLRRERIRLLAERSAELREVDDTIGRFAGTYLGGGRWGIAPADEEKTELGQTMIRVAPLLARRDDLDARLGHLDAEHGPGRAAAALAEKYGDRALVGAVIKAAGRPDAALAGAEKQLAGVASELEKADPESRLAATLRDQLDEARERVAVARDRAKAQAKAEAQHLIELAVAGELVAIDRLCSLSTHAAFPPGFAAELEAALGSPEQLAGTIAAML